MSQSPLPFKFDVTALGVSQGPFNTKIDYSYHCAGDWGKASTIVVAGQATPETLKSIADKLFDSEGFLPKQLGIDSLAPDSDSDEYDDGLDHPVHHFVGFTLTTEAPTVLLTFEQIVNVFIGLKSDNDWDFGKFGL
ncbi:hypothetical protein V0M98_32465 (plasmid) [Pseudomonas silesiensis]|uniref:hypothetical protein n=1 Tax=Pseudomonas silesiensis TaxID=1853130 RepID=UPI0030D475C0